jgi:tetratricopeptide (TPR) repeat protein
MFDLGALFLRDAVIRTQEDLDRHPDSTRAHTNLAQAFWQAGDMDAAAAHCEMALAKDPTNYVAKLLLARVREVQGRADEAVPLYEEVRGERPGDTLALIGLANADIRRNDFGRALQHLQQVVEMDPAATVPLFYLGMVLLRMGRPNEAIAHLKRAAKIDLRSPVLHHALGLAYWSQGARRRAEFQFRSAVHLLSSYAPAVRSLAHLLLLQERFEEAIPVLEAYLALNADNDAVRDLLGWALFEKKDYRHSIEQLKIASTLMERAQREPFEVARVANNIGVGYSRLRDWKNAEPWYVKAISLDREQPEGHHNLARLYLDTDRADRAGRLLEEFRQRNSDDAEAGFLLALTKNNQGKIQDAIAELNRLVDSGDAPAKAFSLLGTLLADEADAPDSAVRVLQEGYRRFPEDRLIGNNLAYAFLLADHAGQAREVLEQYPEASTDDVYLRATWGLLHLHEGDVEKGVDGYMEAQRLAQRQGRRDLARQAKQKMHLELARYQLQKGEYQAAEREVTLGLAIDAKPAYRRSLMQVRRLLPDRTD